MMKPCPFCGYAPTGEEELLAILDVDEFGEKVEKIKYFGVSCAGCGAYVPVQTHDKTEAIAAWNRRPSLPAGHVAVPVEPTPEMLAEAMREADRRGYQHTKGYINEDDARYLYAAMLAALPHNQGEGK